MNSDLWNKFGNDARTLALFVALRQAAPTTIYEEIGKIMEVGMSGTLNAVTMPLKDGRLSANLFSEAYCDIFDSMFYYMVAQSAEPIEVAYMATLMLFCEGARTPNCDCNVFAIALGLLMRSSVRMTRQLLTRMIDYCIMVAEMIATDVRKEYDPRAMIAGAIAFLGSRYLQACTAEALPKEGDALSSRQLHRFATLNCDAVHDRTRDLWEGQWETQLGALSGHLAETIGGLHRILLE